MILYLIQKTFFFGVGWGALWVVSRHCMKKNKLREFLKITIAFKKENCRNDPEKNENLYNNISWYCKVPHIIVEDLLSPTILDMRYNSLFTKHAVCT